MSWKPEVVADAKGTWSGNALRFATQAEAEDWVAGLKDRWVLVSDTRVVESPDPPNFSYHNRSLVNLNA